MDLVFQIYVPITDVIVYQLHDSTSDATSTFYYAKMWKCVFLNEI